MEVWVYTNEEPRNGKYVGKGEILFFLSLNLFEENWHFKEKIQIIYWRFDNIYRSKIYDNNSTKARREEMADYCCKVLMLYMKRYNAT